LELVGSSVSASKDGVRHHKGGDARLH